MEIDAPATSEKRRFVRVQYREAVQFNLGPHRTSGGCLSYDLSVGGLRVSLEDFVPVNSKLIVDLPLGSGKQSQVIQLKGRVVWVQRIRYSDQYLAGLEFSDTEHELKEKAQISEFIHTLSNQSEKQPPR